MIFSAIKKIKINRGSTEARKKILATIKDVKHTYTINDIVNGYSLSRNRERTGYE